jgi:hypothetical protein
MPGEEQNILDDSKFKEAVNSISKRAERQLDYDKLVDIFVQTDLFTRTASTDTQLILGRRGTGKTHMIRVFAQRRKLRGDNVIYVDCTRLGSGYGTIKGLDEYEVAAKYFTAFLNQIATDLLDWVLGMENPAADLQDRLFTRLTTLSGFLQWDSAARRSTFNYRQIIDSFEQILTGLGITRLFVLVDEWAQIPVRSQPHFAEFLKRGLLTVARISVKILAVNYQCEFYETTNGEHIGIQRGADVTDTIDFDTYLIYDEKREQVVDFFGQVLYNHIGAELRWDLEEQPVEKLRRVISLFTQETAFHQLVRAAEGNCRDFLCIFGRSYLDGFLRTRKSRKISIQNVENAAASWFDSEKVSNIKIEQQVYDALTHIFEKVIKGYKSRTFMIEASKSQNPVIMRLLNERVLHKLNILYAHKDEPGVRYELYTLDFGAYVRFKGTDNEPYEGFLFKTEEMPKLGLQEAKYLVPLDDKRSIRRIVFDPDTLNALA